jgi:hypothetical protein
MADNIPLVQPPIIDIAPVEVPDFSLVTEEPEIAITSTPNTVEPYQDWRVKLSLAPNSKYFYNLDSTDTNILEPLRETNGVIFPYTPTINVVYSANYDQTNIVHSNYRVPQYSNSYVDNVTITGEFTAQDTYEANYLLATIHFFRSLTKMFFGQDENPIAGTPPPLCYLSGMGSFQFSNHPLAVTNFSYSLPNDVDYIKTTGPTLPGLALPTNRLSPNLRLPANVQRGGRAAPPNFAKIASPLQDSKTPTWVPTKIQLAITCIPVVSRNDISNRFSLEKYSTGTLIDGNQYGKAGLW